VNALHRLPRSSLVLAQHAMKDCGVNSRSRKEGDAELLVAVSRVLPEGTVLWHCSKASLHTLCVLCRLSSLNSATC